MQFLCRSLLVASAMIGGTFATAQADPQDDYNGMWSVAMVTERGSCDPSYQYGIAIADGAIRGAGGPSVNLSGQVDRSGKVQVVVASGMARAGAVGKLRGNSGSGTWQLPSLGCAGRWSAARAPS